MPSGNVPQYLVLSEINRRKRVRDSYQQQQNEQQSNQTVAQEKLAAAGVPSEGIAGLASSMAPKTDMTQNTGAAPQQQMPMPEAPPPMAEAMPPEMMPPEMSPPQDAGIMSMAGGGYVQRMQAGGTPVSTSKGLFYVSRDGLTVTDIQGNPAPEDVAREARAKKYDFGVRNAAERDAAFPVSSALGRNLGGFFRGITEDGGESAGLMTPPFNDTSIGAPSPLVMRQLPDSNTPIANVTEGMSNLISRFRKDPNAKAPELGMPPIDFNDRIDFPSNKNIAYRAGVIDEQRDAMREPVEATGINPPIDFDARSTDAFPSNRNTQSIMDELDAKREAMRTPTDGRSDVASRTPQKVADAKQRQAARDAKYIQMNEDSFATDIGQLLTESDASRPPLSVDPVDMSKMMPPIFDPRLERSRDPYSAGVDALTQKALQDSGRPIPTEDIGDYLSPDDKGFFERIADYLNLGARERLIVEDQNKKAAEAQTKNEAAKSQVAQDQAKGVVNIDPFAGAESVLSPSAPSSPDISEVLKAVEAAGESEYTSTESEIIKMLKDRQERADKDKWMALAQAGLAIMASNKDLGGAIGEGGMAGLKRLSQSREDYDDAKLALLGMRQKIDASRATRSTAKQKAAREYFDSLIDDLLAQKKANDTIMAKYIATDALSGTTVNNAPDVYKARSATLDKRIQELTAAKMKMLGQSDFNTVQ